MLNNKNSILKTADWVKGKSWDGELIIGYVESMDSVNGTVSVKVVTSDRDETVGKTIEVGSKHLDVLPSSQVRNREQILFLIDLALETGDEAWFQELSSQLKSMKELVNGVR